MSIIFDKEHDGRALILNDVGSEDSWCFCFDKEKNKFLVWDDVNRQIEGHVGEEADTLEQVLEMTRSYT